MNNIYIDINILIELKIIIILEVWGLGGRIVKRFNLFDCKCYEVTDLFVLSFLVF